MKRFSTAFYFNKKSDSHRRPSRSDFVQSKFVEISRNLDLSGRKEIMSHEQEKKVIEQYTGFPEKNRLTYTMYIAFQKGTQTAPQGGTMPPQAGM